MSRAERDKGARREREIVTAHIMAGIQAERVPLSGAAHYQGNGADVDVYAFGKDEAPLVCEVKGRNKIPKWLRDMLGENDALFLVEDRQDKLVVLPWRTWTRVVSK